MPTPLDAVGILRLTIEKELRHPDYERVTSLADLYRKFVTGVGITDLLVPFHQREDHAQFEQRKRLTQCIVPSIVHRLWQPMQRLGRMDNIKRKLHFEKEGTTESDEKREKQLEDALAKYYGSFSLDKFMQVRFMQLSRIDPNAFIVIDFDNDYDPKTGPEPYPVVFSSDECVRFEYKNNVLQWLITMRPIEFLDEKGLVHEGLKYEMYTKDVVHIYTQNKVGGPREIENYAYTVSKPYAEGDPKKVPAIRVGYMLDEDTDGRTCVSPIQPAVPYLMKIVKGDSERDVTNALHAFPQKIAYYNPCPGNLKTGVKCQFGFKMASTEECDICHGSGVATHRSSQDTILMQIPKTNLEAIDLDKVVVYKYPPTELLEHIRTDIDQHVQGALQTMYNGDTLQKQSVEQTATETLVTQEQEHNTMFPLAEQFANVWKFQATIAAVYLNLWKGLTPQYEFPSDFRIKTLADLLLERKAAVDAGAPAFVLSALDDQIAAKQYADDPIAHRKYQIRKQHTPFTSMAALDVWTAITSGKVDHQDEALWLNQDRIFTELEQEYPKFYEFEYKKLKSLLVLKIQSIIQAIPPPPQPETFNPDQAA